MNFEKFINQSGWSRENYIDTHYDTIKESLKECWQTSRNKAFDDAAELCRSVEFFSVGCKDRQWICNRLATMIEEQKEKI